MSGGIKRRGRTVDAAAVEAFSAGAESHTIETAPPAPAKPKVNAGKPTASSDNEQLPKSMEVRFSDDALPRRIRDLAAREDRSRHKIALMALELGLAQLEQ